MSSNLWNIIVRVSKMQCSLYNIVVLVTVKVLSLFPDYMHQDILSSLYHSVTHNFDTHNNTIATLYLSNHSYKCNNHNIVNPRGLHSPIRATLPLCNTTSTPGIPNMHHHTIYTIILCTYRLTLDISFLQMGHSFLAHRTLILVEHS